MAQPVVGVASVPPAALRRQIAVAGAETDVCILQSTLGLLEAGYEVFLLEDCLSTTEASPGPALRRGSVNISRPRAATTRHGTRSSPWKNCTSSFLTIVMAQ